MITILPHYHGQGKRSGAIIIKTFDLLAFQEDSTQFNPLPATCKDGPLFLVVIMSHLSIIIIISRSLAITTITITMATVVMDTSSTTTTVVMVGGYQ